jgi:hypothetical protein
MTPTAPIIPKPQAEAMRAAQTAPAPKPEPVAEPAPKAASMPMGPQKVKVVLVHAFKLHCPTQDRTLWPGAEIELEADAWVKNQLAHNYLKVV